MNHPDKAWPLPFWRRTLSLRQKATLITTGVLVTLAALLALGIDRVFRQSSSELEAQWVAESVRRVEAAQAGEFDALVRSCRDYATWTDTYDFMVDATRPYVANNLMPATFANLQIDAFLLFEPSGRLRADYSYNDGAVSETGPEEISGALASYARQAAAGEGRLVKGIVKTRTDIVLFAMLPIVRDDGSGPPRGALAQIRRVSAERVARLRQAVNLDLRLHEPTGAEDDRGIEARLALEGRPFATAALGDEIMVVHLPLLDVDGRIAAIWHLVLPRQIHRQGVQARLLFYGVMSVLIVAAAVLISWLLRRLVIGRLETLHAAVTRVGATGDLSTRLPVKGADELAQLAAGINHMFEALERSDAERHAAMKEREQLNAQLQQAQKMEAIGTLAGGLAHDFNNLLTSIQGSATLLRLETPPDPTAEQHIRRIEQATTQAAGLVRQMLAFGRRSPTAAVHVHVAAAAQDVMQLLRASLPRGIRFSFINDARDDLVHIDPSQLQQVLINLATNASHAMASGQGELTVRLSEVMLPDPLRPETAGAKPGNYLRIAVGDTGCGIPPENLARIFEPFFTTKPVGSGTGLGLAVVHGIVTQHEGTIGVTSVVGRGTTVLIHLPKVAAAATAEAPPIAPSSGGGRVLLVDDDELVRRTLEAGLRRLGYDVVSVEGGAQALERIRANGANFLVMLTDQMMPGMSGTELGEILKAECPKLPKVLMTGYAAALEEPQVRAMGFAAMLMKPATIDELDSVIRRVRAA